MPENYSEVQFLAQNANFLPLKCLVLAPLINDPQWDGQVTPVSVSLTNFDKVMLQLSPSVSVEVENKLLCELMQVENQTLEVTYYFSDLASFTPSQIVRRDPTLFNISNLIVLIKNQLQNTVYCADTVSSSIQNLPLSIDEQMIVNRATAEYFVLQLQGAVSDVLSQMLHHTNWQTIESAWRSIHWLCQQQAESGRCQIDVLATNKEVLWEDLMHSASPEDSELFQLLYSRNYGQFGAVPYGVMLVDSYFSITGSGLSLLKRLSELGENAHVPVVTACSPECFGLDEFTELAYTDGLIELHQGARFVKWRSFIASESASYLLMTLPRIRIRPLYEQLDENPDNYSWFTESFANNNEHLWTNAGYAFLINLMKSFEQHGFCSAISGRYLGSIEHRTFNGASAQLPLEITIPQTREAQLIRLGFNPIVVRDQGREMLFNSGNSVRWGHVMSSRRVQSADALASAQLSYLLIVLRIVHCLKILFRERVGLHETTASLQSYINSWLRQFVSAVEVPSEAMRAERPLKDAGVVIGEKDGSGWYDIGLSLQPHLKYLGKNVTVELSIPIAEGGS